MTGGLIELDPASEITQTPIVDPNGTTILFDLIFRGDLIGTVAYILSSTEPRTQGSLTYSGIYRLVNSTFSSVNRASLQLSYARLSRSVSLKLLFEANQETFLTDLLTFDSDMKACSMLSSSMYPTLQVGDLIIVQECTDPSAIYAAPLPQGDIVAFWHLNPWGEPEVWIHRAVGKMTVDSKTYLITQGDANDARARIDTHYNMTSGYPSPDVLPGLPMEYVIGKAMERIPIVGQLLSMAGFSVQTLSEDYASLIRDFLNEVQTLTLKLTHQGADRIFTARMSFVFDIEGFQEKILPKLPELVPETYYEIMVKLVNNIYSNITSADISFSYRDGQVNCLVSFLIQGNFAEEINLLKNIYINETTKYMQPNYWNPWLMINQTWVDACNIKAHYDVEESKAFFYLEGLKALPSIDYMNATTFRLNQFFNFTAPTSPYQLESPRSGEQLKLTVQGCNNGTHIVTLFRPDFMPAPDYVSEDSTLMIWNNQSISILKDLIFSIQYHCDIPWDGQTYSIITHSNGTASSVIFDQPLKKLYLTIDGPSDAVGFANVSIPSVLLNAQPESWRIVVGNRTIVYPEYQVTTTATHTFLYFTFTFGSPISIQIIGTEALLEFPHVLVLIIFSLAILSELVVCKRMLRKLNKRLL
jgi:signal peptidase I